MNLFETNGIDWNKVLEVVVNWMTSTGIKLVIGIVLLIVLFKIIDLFCKKLLKRLEKKGTDETISKFVIKIMKIVLKVIVLTCLVGYIGIETASISAVIASLGIGISLAVQGTLSNFAGGIIIIVMRPFKLGDFITSNGESGTVEDIKLFYTYLKTPDNRVVIIPNGSLANNVIVNVSMKEDRRVDVRMSVAYDSNIELCKNLIRKVCYENELIYKNPDVFVEIGEFSDSSIDLFVRVWCKNTNYWDVNFYLLDRIKKEFDSNGIEIPFNQLDVNIKK